MDRIAQTKLLERNLVRITMIKKRLLNGDACEKCAQTEEMLRRRNLWEEIDEVVWAIEGDANSPGALLGETHGIEVAPFFILESDDGEETVYTSPLKMIRDHFAGAPKPVETLRVEREDVSALNRRFAQSEPAEILQFALERYGDKCGIAFSGAEDVVLIDMASKLDRSFRVFTLDTGRLNPETYVLLDEVRRHYGIQIDTFFPDQKELVDFVNENGLNSFYRDGHWECCSIRKLRPLGRALASFDAWITGRRRDGRPPSELAVIETDPSFVGSGSHLVRFNPLAGFTRVDVFDYIRRHDVPTNPLHQSGFVSIGCAPCTRARSESPDEPDRWWWEDRAAGPPTPDPGSGI